MTKIESNFALTRRHVATRAGLILALALLAGCVVRPEGRVVVREPGAVVVVRAPPAPRYEAPPPAPNDRVVWDPGHWQWDGHDYAWLPGHYEERPVREARWEPGHWDQRGGGWVWAPGHWDR